MANLCSAQHLTGYAHMGVTLLSCRDLWASAWYTEMRQRLNRELKAWDQSPTGRQIGVERPYPKLWLNEIFGKDWDQMKARRLPPQRSKQSKVKGARTRYRAGRRAN